MFDYRVLSILCLCYSIAGSVEITDKEYALMPELFHLDNYDHCMLYREDALYCTITYDLAPLDQKNSSKIWKTIEKISSDPSSYRHDKLRHGVCVTTTCPNITKSNFHEEDEALRTQVTECYNAKYTEMGLGGKITEIHCETIDPVYEVDNLDIAVAVIFVLYITLVLFSSFYEGLARYKPQQDYDRIIGTKFGRFMAALSICRNWYRLKTVKNTEEVKSLRVVQGIRFYNMVLVIFSHSVLVALGGHVSNTKFTETLKDKFTTIILTNGGYAVQTFFLLSGWLLTYHMFLAFDNKREIEKKHLVSIFIQRYLRLTPTLLAVLAFQSTWIRHVSRGPTWDEIVGTSFRNCRRNWWSNLLYLNTYIDPKHMCMPHTWYLGVDTQLFALELMIIYTMLKNRKHIGLILTTIAILSVVIFSAVIYINDYDPIVWPYPEYLYRFRFLETTKWHVILGSVYSNSAGLVVGIGFGYAFYLYRGKRSLKNNCEIAAWWFVSLLFPLGIIIMPGLYMFSQSYQHSIWFSVLYSSLGRMIFAFGIAVVIMGMSSGPGTWIAKWICEWPPTYVLGRLSYSSYLVHVSLTFMRVGVKRSNVFISPYIIICDTFSDVGISLVAATLLTLFVELPSSEFLKMALGIRNEPDRFQKAGNGVIQKSKVT